MVVILVTALVLMTIITICVFIYTSKMLDSVEMINTNSVAEVTEEEKFSAFCDAYDFSEREREVMCALLQNNERMSDIATSLLMSRTVLYRYVSKLNEKTQTNNRVGLLQYYLQWKIENMN